MSISHDTLIRLIRRQPISVPLLGVDDWSYRRGKTYGTLLRDLSTSRPIDLFDDRQAATLAEWLRHHPAVQVVSRDRGGEYARGARQGAPQALQRADRFPLVRNLAEALERGWHRHRKTLSAIRVAKKPEAGGLAVRYARASSGRAKARGKREAGPAL